MTGDQLASIMPEVARHFWGEPNPRHSNGKELRWGTNGARCVDLAKGTWFDLRGEGRRRRPRPAQARARRRSVAMAARKWVCRTP